MEDAMDNGEFWLPAEFLDDDFFSEDNGVDRRGLHAVRNRSPLMAECEDEDYMAAITRHLNQVYLQDGDDDDNASRLLRSRDYPKLQQPISRSPKTPLFDYGIWSNAGSPNGSSPPSTPMEQRDAAWDLLAAAAGHVAQLRQQQEKLAAGAIRGAPPYSNPVFTQQQLQAERFYRLKQQQVIREQLSLAWGRQLSRGKRNGRPLASTPVGLQGYQRTHQSPAPAPAPAQVGSGMRAIFLNGAGNRRESVGTGVFLPRRPGNATEPRRKPACSTVLLPDRVVRALNLEEMGGPNCFRGGFNDATMGRAKGLLRPNPFAAGANYEAALLQRGPINPQTHL